MDEPLSLLPEGTFSAQFGAQNYSNAFVPDALNSGAESFLDVLKYGVGRIADYKIATVTPQNTGNVIAGPGRAVATTAATAAAATNQLAGMLPMLAVVGLVLLVAMKR